MFPFQQHPQADSTHGKHRGLDSRMNRRQAYVIFSGFVGRSLGLCGTYGLGPREGWRRRTQELCEPAPAPPIPSPFTDPSDTRRPEMR